MAQFELLLSNFKQFFTSSEAEAAKEQFVKLKKKIQGSAALNTLPYKELWPRILLHFRSPYLLALRVVVVALLLVCDTSECERIFSLMNNVESAKRDRLGHDVLRNLMLWARPEYFGSMTPEAFRPHALEILRPPLACNEEARQRHEGNAGVPLEVGVPRVGRLGAP